MDVENLSIGQFLKAMKVSHLWAVIIAICAVVGVAFKTGQVIGQDQRQKEAFATQLSNDKEEFITRYLRYETTRRLIMESDVSLEEYEEIRKQHELAEKMFTDLIARWWKNQNELDGQILMKKIIRKGWNPKDSKITFADDTSWPIPPEIKSNILETE
ncbi:MAG: hypothetical protein KAK04_08020 [Cyclobacteriaceae bacterium]|nr:hypothetical protein [Cyclobacteriaceae bacterium]